MPADATDPPASPPPRQPFWFRRRRVPVPTWKTWFVLLTAAGIAGWLLIPRLHGWLSPIDPLEKPPYIVIEGWVPDYVMEEAINDITTAPVKRIFATGVPLDTGTFLSEYRDYAHLCAASLAKMGVQPGLICPAPAPLAKTERTRAMALALKEVLDGENIPPADRRINLYTLGTHGWRSRYIFQEALGSDWKVGVISIPSENYDTDKWYRQSAGAKTVLNELIAIVMQTTGSD